MQDNEYKLIVDDILKNKTFKKLKDETHHVNTNRYDHSLKVSYQAYKISKKLNLDYTSVARAALLHDFFFNKEFSNKNVRILTHYKSSVKNALKITDLNEKEKNIIESHMYPVGGKVPKSMEALVVDLVDDTISFKERGLKFTNRLSVVGNFLLIILINFFKI